MYMYIIYMNINLYVLGIGSLFINKIVIGESLETCKKSAAEKIDGKKNIF
jgi:hypothetical protein